MGRSRKRWVAYGCGGCALLAVLVVVAGALVGRVVSRSSPGADERQVRELSPPTPAPPASGGLLPTELSAPGDPLRVLLDLRHAEFDLAPAPAGEPLRVEATFDPARFELTEDSQRGADGMATHRIAFRRTGGWVASTLRQLLGGTAPSVRVLLPRDRPLLLEAAVAEGALRADLDGLALRRGVLRVEQGGLEVDIPQPLATPMERLELHGSMGGFAARGIGNASPAELVVDMSMGGMELDLRGAWRQDAAVRIDSRMAGGQVRLPDDVVIQGLDRGTIRVEPPRELPRPTLRFEVSATTGELVFE